MESYTLDQIKAAFWEEFHEAGELWFGQGGLKEGYEIDNDSYTEEFWESFLEHLTKN